MDATSSRSAQTTRMLWSLRAHGWLVVVSVLLLAAAPLLILRPAALYEAETLVIARQLAVSTKALPRLGVPIFNNGAVARGVTADPAIGGDPATLIPNRVRLVAAEDSIVFIVIGRDADPSTASRLANVAGAVFVDELNRAGAGVGAFALQSEARIPSEPVPGLNPPLLAAAGGVLGLLIGLGIVALLLAVRRPVIVAADVSPVLNARVLGTMVLGRDGNTSHPRQIAGIAPVTRRLADVRTGRILFVSDAETAAVRHRVVVLLAGTLSSFRRISVVSTGPHPESPRSGSNGDTPTPWRRSSGEPSDELVLVDGDETPEMLDRPDTRLSVVLVVRRGTPRSLVRSVADGYLPEELFGVVLVEVRGGRRRTLRADVRSQNDLEPAGKGPVAP